MNEEVWMADFVTLARLALAGRDQDVAAFVQKTARRYRADHPEATRRMIELLRESPSRASPLRKNTAQPLPVDGDSRLQLLRIEHPGALEIDPILPPAIDGALRQIVAEHMKGVELAHAGLSPSRAVLFVGPPGVGKTLSAKWIASQLEKPILVLDLSAVMSSYLGRTGGNVRAVIDYAKSENCVLFLDELDAVAKRRDDSGEVGELKRLVNVLLQEIDDWPSGSLLLAATNHPDLLDPAVWRRFDATIEFPPPGEAQIRKAVGSFLGDDAGAATRWIDLLTDLFRHRNLSDVQRSLLRARRSKVVNGSSIEDELKTVVSTHAADLPRKDRIALGLRLQSMTGFSDSRIHELTGVSRVTLRKKRAADPDSTAQPRKKLNG